ncbi:MAG: hypothetical protein ACOY4I_07030 [Bacillota bacterium]
MSDEKDRVEAKIEGVDVSGYMPGPVLPTMFPPPTMCPPDHKDDMHMMDTLSKRLKKLKGLQVTVYVMGMGPVGAVPLFPSAGTGVVPATGTMGITGMLHEVGMDYIELHVMMGGSMCVVLIPMMALAAVVPGGPLITEVQPEVVTTVPGIL